MRGKKAKALRRTAVRLAEESDSGLDSGYALLERTRGPACLRRRRREREQLVEALQKPRPGRAVVLTPEMAEALVPPVEPKAHQIVSTGLHRGYRVMKAMYRRANSRERRTVR